jgi:hypothetical protein
MALTLVELTPLQNSILYLNWGVWLPTPSLYVGPTTHQSGIIFSSSLHDVLARLFHACGPELLPPSAVQLTPPRPHLGRPHPTGAWPWHPWCERLTKLRRRQLTSLDLQRLDPLLGCGGPAGVCCDGRHSAIASPTHP